MGSEMCIRDRRKAGQKRHRELTSWNAYPTCHRETTVAFRRRFNWYTSRKNWDLGSIPMEVFLSVQPRAFLNPGDTILVSPPFVSEITHVRTGRAAGLSEQQRGFPQPRGHSYCAPAYWFQGHPRTRRTSSPTGLTKASFLSYQDTPLHRRHRSTLARHKFLQ